MHTTLEKGTVNVPAFLTKLWKIVEDKTYDRLICWSATGKSFIIRNQSLFAKELLPQFFKHNNMASFIRQLNMYGFRKLTSIENSGLRTMDKDEVEFFHQYFIKGQENLLELIKRKVTTGVCGGDDSKKKPEVHGILAEVRDIKGRQESVDMVLSNMQRENEALWREIAMLRQKYQKQQQIVDKLIQFLLSLVHNRGIVKRKAPLMIDDINHEESGPKITLLSSGSSGRGPVIHDVTDYISEHDITENLPNFVNAASPIVDDKNRNPVEGGSPANNISEILDPLDMLDPLQSVVNETLVDDGGLDLQAIASNSLSELENAESKDVKSSLNTHSPLNTPPSSPNHQETISSLPKSEALDLVPSNHQTLNQRNRFYREPFNDHLEGIETELGWLQEQLSSGNFNIDSNSLLSLFDTEDSIDQFCTNSNLNRYGRNFNEIIGNELIQYTPLSSLTPDVDLTSIPEAETTKQTPIDVVDEKLESQSNSICASLNQNNTTDFTEKPSTVTERAINGSKRRKLK